MNLSIRKLRPGYLGIWLLLILLFVVIKPVISQNIRFEHISIDDGLSQSSVLSIVQDNLGFIWFGTHDGLNRYDGYDFTIFKKEKNANNSISGNIIFDIYLCRDNTLWIGTNGDGLNRYNVENELFTHYEHDPENTNSLSDNVIRCILEDETGNLWLGTENYGLNKFNVKQNIFTHFRHQNDSNTIANDKVNALMLDKKNNLWIGTERGVNILNLKTNKITYFNLEKNTFPAILSITTDKNGEIWIGSKIGLYRYEPTKEKITKYANKENDNNSLSFNIVTKIFVDADNNVWIGTSNGLNIYNRKDDNFYVFKHSASNPKGINHDNISSIFQDNAGIIWIGTWERGLSKYDKKSNKFMLYQNSISNPNSIPDKTVRAVYEDTDASLWLGLVEGGLIHFDRNSLITDKYLHNKNNSKTISSNTPTAMLRDSYGNLWIGTWEHGLNRAVEKKNERNGLTKIDYFINYKFSETDKNTISDNTIQAIYEDTRKNLWICTAKGLNLYDKKKDSFIRFSEIVTLSSTSIQAAIQEDAQGNIWVGTWQGLNKINYNGNIADTKVEIFKHTEDDINSLGDNRIISLLIDKQQNIWIGTFGGGINKLSFTKETPNFVAYTEADGLSNNVIYCLYDDSEGNIWASTNKGISKLDVKAERFTIFDENDGLQSKEFFWGAGCKSKTGELFFGGINGLNAFFPEQIENNDFVPPIVITSFKLFNEEVKIGEKLEKSIILTDKIELSYTDEIFAFEFSALHFSNPSQNEYEYKLEGFNKHWLKASASHRLAYYTNIDPGRYVFKVRGSNNDGTWNEVGKSLIIIIHPPFWETWLFRIMSFFFIIFLVLSIFRWRLQRIERQKQKLEQEVVDRTQEIMQKNQLLNQQKDEIQAQAEELKAINDELLKLSIVAAETDNAIIITDNTGEIEWINEGFTRLYGYQIDEYTAVYGTNIKESFKNTNMIKIFDQLIDTKHTIIFEQKLCSKQKTEIWVQTTLTPILDEYSQIIKIIGIDADISKLKEAEMEIREKNKKIEFQNDNIKKSINYAETIQQAILPSEKWIQKFYDNFILYRPKDIVSGDFYWFSSKNVETATEKTTYNFIAVIDCTGHGVPGAFMSMIGNRLLNEIVNERNIYSPADILDMLNKNIIKALNQEESHNNDGMDICLCRIEQENPKLYNVTFCGAKRPLFYLNATDMIINKISGTRKSAGGRQSTYNTEKFENTTIALLKQSIIYLTSDGYADQNNPNRDSFKQKRMIQIMQNICHLEMNTQKEVLDNELIKFQANSEQRDDITIVGIKL